jgi:hypothetical protein
MTSFFWYGGLCQKQNNKSHFLDAWLLSNRSTHRQKLGWLELKEEIFLLGHWLDLIPNKVCVELPGYINTIVNWCLSLFLVLRKSPVFLADNLGPYKWCSYKCSSSWWTPHLTKHGNTALSIPRWSR